MAQTRNPFEGRWRIIEMELWDQEAFDLVGPARFTFNADNLGEFQFICVLAVHRLDDGKKLWRVGFKDHWPPLRFRVFLRSDQFYVATRSEDGKASVIRDLDLYNRQRTLELRLWRMEVLSKPLAISPAEATLSCMTVIPKFEGTVRTNDVYARQRIKGDVR